MGNVEFAVRRIDNLYRAWTAVRSNVNASGHDRFKAEVERISENPIPHLRRIQQNLHSRRFVFAGQHGVVKTKTTGKKRPIVVAPINNRIVQRAILNVLQSEDDRIMPHLGDIPSALRTSTSVGGIPKRGVSYGIKIVNEAIKSGATHYLRSDIRDFFTKVPKASIANFVREQTRDEEFTILFEQAMATELDNADEIKDYLYLFPLEDIGVPQGSSHLGDIPSALRTSTSVGGIPKRGVSYGIKIVNEAIKSGATHYLRSDIRDFFTKVPKASIANFVREQTRDEEFTILFEQAMATELDNADFSLDVQDRMGGVQLLLQRSKVIALRICRKRCPAEVRCTVEWAKHHNRTVH